MKKITVIIVEESNKPTSGHFREPEKEGWCMGESCGNRTRRIGPNLNKYCDSCKKKRNNYFKRKYYDKMGWDTSKIDD